MGPDIIRSVGDGTLPMVWSPAPFLTGDIPIIDVAQQFLVQSPFEFEAVWHANWSAIEAKFAERNVKLLKVGCYDKQMLGSAEPISTLEDWQDKLVRTYGISIDVVEAMGASAVTVESSEIYLAFQRGIADSITTGAFAMDTLSLYEFLDYVQPEYGFFAGEVMIINIDLWESFPGDIKYIILDEAIREERQSIVEAAMGAGTAVEALLGLGMELAPPLSQEVWDKIYEEAPILWNQWADQHGPVEKAALELARQVVGR